MQTRTHGPWPKVGALVELMPEGHQGRRRWEEALRCTGHLLEPRWPATGYAPAMQYAVETCALVLYAGPWALSADTPSGLSAQDLASAYREVEAVSRGQASAVDQVCALGHDVVGADQFARLLALLVEDRHPSQMFDLSLVPSMEQPVDGPIIRWVARWVFWALDAHQPAGA